MANLDQVNLIRKSRQSWNEWRENTSLAYVDLNSADLSGLDLSHTNLRLADLRGVNFSGANLTGANFSASSLINANMENAVLDIADFSFSDLSSATLTACSLRNTLFVASNLYNTVLNEKTLLSNTVFRNVLFDKVIGLEKCVHIGRSSIDVATLEMQKNIPLRFLQGCGIPDKFIRLYENVPETTVPQYYSCFISYSHSDKKFATFLHDYLQNMGVRCWLDEHQLLPGDDPHDKIRDGIRLWDKVLLCCSKESMKSWWVDNEIETTFNKERELMKERGNKVYKLIPINLDNFIFGESWESGKKEQILSRMAANFVGWEKSVSNIEEPLSKVLGALICDSSAREKPPIPKL